MHVHSGTLVVISVYEIENKNVSQIIKIGIIFVQINNVINKSVRITYCNICRFQLFFLRFGIFFSVYKMYSLLVVVFFSILSDDLVFNAIHNSTRDV